MILKFYKHVQVNINVKISVM